MLRCVPVCLEGSVSAMALTKLLTKPMKLFQKDVISFLIIVRHDLGSNKEEFKYVAVKPTASISTLRQKLWHLLELPDYCEEIIILKTNDKVQIPLTDLRKGNEPQFPFILEVWLPARSMHSTTATSTNNNMLTMGLPTIESRPIQKTSSDIDRERQDSINTSLENGKDSLTTMTTETMLFNKFKNFIPMEHKKAGSRFSTTSFFVKTRSKDNFTSVLLKIQSDLATLSTKLSTLENKIPV